MGRLFNNIFAGKGLGSFLALVLACASLCSCGNKKQEEKSLTRPFPRTTLSTVIVPNGSNSAEYLAGHYWDDFFASGTDWLCDSSTVMGVTRDELETAYGTFAAIVVQMCSPQAGAEAMKALFEKSEYRQKKDSLNNVFEAMNSLTEKYFYDPQSPLRNEDLYLPYVSRLAKSTLVPEELRQYYEYVTKMCSMNRQGTPAADFVFKDAAGRSRNLYDVKADFTLLYFSNPGCPSCAEVTEDLASDEVFTKLVHDGTVTVVSMYIDRDIDLWKEHLDDYPKEWYVGYDPTYTIRQDIKYNVRAIPSLYLLGPDKKVIFKDAPPEQVRSFLSTLSEGLSQQGNN